MQEATEIQSSTAIHTILQSVVFRTKASLLQLRRALTDRAGVKIRKFLPSGDLTDARIVADSRTPLWTETAPQERFLLAGKAQNLRVALRTMDGIVIPKGEVFSFWRQVGRTTRRKGYVVGRELREGCVIPNVGGGLCQLSNALYDAALQAGFEIVERHAHTRVIAGSLAEQGRDATVFWNYVDLRFRATEDFRIEAELDHDSLRVVFRSNRPVMPVLVNIQRHRHSGGGDPKQDSPNSCASCGVESCFRSLAPDAHADFGRTAFLVDEFSPEFDEYLRSTAKASKDLLFSPINGNRWGKANYAWTTADFARRRHATFTTLRRAWQSRRLASQGAARQRSLLRSAEELAADFAARLPFDATHLVVSQNLLPYLWRNGHLGGRTFDVLMTQLPLGALQTKLDAASKLHPDSPTLADFRLPSDEIATEQSALAAARRIITPHRAIADLFGERSVKLAWHQPAATVGRNATPQDKLTLYFPASTVGRKGCYELRDAVRGLDVRLLLGGPILESSDFWSGIDHQRVAGTLPDGIAAVVLPAFVEHRPRRLLAALSAGIPVIATAACGIDGVTVIPDGSVSALRDAILALPKI